MWYVTNLLHSFFKGFQSCKCFISLAQIIQINGLFWLKERLKSLTFSINNDNPPLTNETTGIVFHQKHKERNGNWMKR